MNEVKYVYLKSPLSITGGFAPTNVITPAQFRITVQEDGSVNLFPLVGNSIVHHIYANNISCITYILPSVVNIPVSIETKDVKRKYNRKHSNAS